MRNFRHILLFMLVATTLVASAASLKKIYNALKAGDANDLSSYFDDRILLTIKGGGFNIQNTYSKTQAKGVIKDFFEKSNPSAFDEKHRNDDKEKPLYSIGYLKTKKGTYRTLIRVKGSDGNMKIQEIELSLDKSVDNDE
ncbi:MAG: DUF4783 domain-containing protein [Bacteroidetes bacterium]|nr:DUF4783 domain-containing protein [Bacteroidota bacterium]